MKVSTHFKNILRKFTNILSGSNFPSQLFGGLGLHNAEPAGGVGRYSTAEAVPTDSKVGSNNQPKKYTAQEVKAYLRGVAQGERARPVMLQASQFSILLEERMRRHFRGRERIFDRLPYVLFQYVQGLDASEIARSVSYFADSEDIEQAMDFASILIANRVNRSHQRALRY